MEEVARLAAEPHEKWSCQTETKGARWSAESEEEAEADEPGALGRALDLGEVVKGRQRTGAGQGVPEYPRSRRRLDESLELASTRPPWRDAPAIPRSTCLLRQRQQPSSFRNLCSQEKGESSGTQATPVAQCSLSVLVPGVSAKKTASVTCLDKTQNQHNRRNQTPTNAPQREPLLVENEADIFNSRPLSKIPIP